ncbi:MAG: hypothetical protein EB060_01655 [Proteobacteria bacterium]|nr:hypothetical protein [Pseudomonadota bacterium]
MHFTDLIAPLSLDEFARRTKAGEYFVIEGNTQKFKHLITLEDIEKRLNDGCNFNIGTEIIGGGKRGILLDEKIPWSNTSLKKREMKALLEGGHSFLMRNQSQINRPVAALIDSLENHIQHARADVHLYVSPKGGGTGYNAHRDRPQHKIYLQVIGSTTWKIFTIVGPLDDHAVAVEEADEAQYLKEEAEFVLKPGDMFYMPPAVFHKVRNHHGPRVSISIPFTIMQGSPRMDRTFIPFKDIFESA